jgi:hypothetical protein
MQAKGDSHWKQDDQVRRQSLSAALKAFGLIAVLLFGVLAICWGVLNLQR